MKEFKDVWFLFDLGEQIEYRTNIDFQPKEKQLIIIDESDAIIFRDPIKFKELIVKSACICFTATPDNQDKEGTEYTVLKYLGL